MTDLNLPFIFVFSVGLVFPVITRTSLFFFMSRKIRLSRSDGTKFHQPITCLEFHT